MRELGVIAGEEVIHSLRHALLGHPISLARWGSSLEDCEPTEAAHVVVELSRRVCSGGRRLPARARFLAGIPVDEESEGIASRLGVDVLLGSPEDLLAWFDHSAGGTHDEPGTPDARGAIISVHGPHGAPGVSTIAANLAARLSQGIYRVVLVDANTYAPSLDLSLSLPRARSGLVQATRVARLDGVTAASVSSQTIEYRGERSAFLVLAGIPDPGQFADIDEAALRRLLERLREDGYLVIVDCAPPWEMWVHEVVGGPVRNAATRVGLQAADALVIVATASPIHLERLIRAWPGVSSLAPEATTIPVLNRVPRNSRGVIEEASDALWQLAGIDDLVVIPEDVSGFTRALHAGATLVDVSPTSPVLAALDLLIGRMDLGDVIQPRRDIPRGRTPRP